jgi:hypothetical protein
LPLQIPTLDDRRYQELLDETLARIPVHNPEWTNFNKSDPGVTLVELFAFLTENLLYRSNQIPERNRRKFLTLLGVPLQPASSARGVVTLINERGPLQTLTLNEGLEVRAGQVPFRTERGLDVLPIEAQVFYKRKIVNADRRLQDYYKLLYSSYNQPPEDNEFQLYENVPLDPRKTEGVDLGQETADGSLWIALLLRAGDKPADKTEEAKTARLDEAREAIAGKTLSLGIVPVLSDVSRRLVPAGPANPESAALLQYQIPSIPSSGGLAADPLQRTPRYKALPPTTQSDVLAAPGIVDITLPAAAELKLWNNLEPLEPGAGDFPPALDDTNLGDRVITWLRITSTAAAAARLLWVGINAVFVNQRARVSNEVLPDGSGAPDQVMVLSRKPVVPGSVRLTITTTQGETKQWAEIDDLFSAGPEVKVPDLRSPPGAPPSIERPFDVFTVNPESGEIKFGDGMRGKRPPLGATVRATYDYGVGAAGNVGEGAINSSPSLPAGLKVSNPVRTWNGTEAETVSEGEKQITKYLQHRDRLVSAADFETITWRTPGVDIGRVEVIPAFNPALAPNEPGGAPGAVTLMLIPRFDPTRPAAPKPDRLFLDTVCRYLDPRRLITTELFLLGPDYKDIWITVGINVVAGTAVPTVREAVKQDILKFLAPFDPSHRGPQDDMSFSADSGQGPRKQNGWPLRKAVTDRELLAVASRVPGVLLVNDVKIAEGTKPTTSQINMNGLELPRVAGISVTVGEPLDPDQLRGQTPATTTPSPTTPVPKMVPVPVVPEEC